MPFPRPAGARADALLKLYVERFNAAGVDLIAAMQEDLRLAGSRRGTR
jgi:hypothetical protein